MMSKGISNDDKNKTQWKQSKTKRNFLHLSS